MPPCFLVPLNPPARPHGRSPSARSFWTRRLVWALLSLLLLTAPDCGGMPAQLDHHAAAAPAPPVPPAPAEAATGTGHCPYWDTGHCPYWDTDTVFRTAQQPPVRAGATAHAVAVLTTLGAWPRRRLAPADARSRIPREGRTVLAAVCRWRI